MHLEVIQNTSGSYLDYIGGHARPCMVIYGYAWPSMAMHGNAWPYTPPCMAMYGHDEEWDDVTGGCLEVLEGLELRDCIYTPRGQRLRRI